MDLGAAPFMARAELGAEPRAGEIAAYRILGLRHLAQATVGRRTGWRHLGAAVDLAHIASMAVLLLTPRYRRAATVQIVFAVAMLVPALATPASEDAYPPGV